MLHKINGHFLAPQTKTCPEPNLKAETRDKTYLFPCWFISNHANKLKIQFIYRTFTFYLTFQSCQSQFFSCMTKVQKKVGLGRTWGKKVGLWQAFCLILFKMPRFKEYDNLRPIRSP